MTNDEIEESRDMKLVYLEMKNLKNEMSSIKNMLM
jgi:hypothetical protein